MLLGFVCLLLLSFATFPEHLESLWLGGMQESCQSLAGPWSRVSQCHSLAFAQIFAPRFCPEAASGELSLNNALPNPVEFHPHRAASAAAKLAMTPRIS